MECHAVHSAGESSYCPFKKWYKPDVYPIVKHIHLHYYLIYHILVGGLEHFLFSHIWGIIIPIDFHIFQRGGPTTNQYMIYHILCSFLWMIWNCMLCFGICPWDRRPNGGFLRHGGPVIMKNHHGWPWLRIENDWNHHHHADFLEIFPWLQKPSIFRWHPPSTAGCCAGSRATASQVSISVSSWTSAAHGPVAPFARRCGAGRSPWAVERFSIVEIGKYLKGNLPWEFVGWKKFRCGLGKDEETEFLSMSDCVTARKIEITMKESLEIVWVSSFTFIDNGIAKDKHINHAVLGTRTTRVQLPAVFLLIYIGIFCRFYYLETGRWNSLS